MARGPVATAPSRDNEGSADSTPSSTVPLIGTEMTLGSASADNETLLASWRKKLADAGVSSGDQQIVLKILGRYALDPKRLTAVYRIDPAEFDRLLPLEIVPQPRKVSRIALVVVTGIDPSLGDELKEWIKQLGDPSWEKREAAMEEIKKMGAKAKSQLEAAAKDKDMEVVYRVEQLLQAASAPEKVEQQN